MTDTATSTHCGDLAALHLEVAAIRAGLDRRDMEAATVENAIEFLEGRSATLLMVLGQVVRIMLGPDHELFKSLYPDPVGPYPNTAAGFSNTSGPSVVTSGYGSVVTCL